MLPYFIGFIFILIVLFAMIGLAYSFYKFIKKEGYKKRATIFAFIFTLIALSFCLFLVFEDQLFFKSDVKKLLAEQDIILHDDFVIEQNESSSAIGGDFLHQFKLSISNQDKKNIANQILTSSNFIKEDSNIVNLVFIKAPKRYHGKKIIQNYVTDYFYVREYLQPNGEGYSPTFRRISISKKQSGLEFKERAE